MTENKRMPHLTIDEVILLIDTYFQIRDMPSTPLKKTLIQELSDTMRALPFFPELKVYPSFRSFSGMRMCLLGVAHIDPEKSASFGHGTSLERSVYHFYSDKQSLLHSIAKTIKAISSLDFPLLPAYKNSIMGQLLPSYHEYLERNDKVVNNAKKMVMTQGKTSCSVCGCDLEAIYPGRGYELLDAHIALPIIQLNGQEKITYSDI